MPHLLKLAAPIVRPRASLHADQARGTLLKKCEQLTATKLATHKNSTVLVDTMDLEDAFCEVDTNSGKFRHGGLLCSDNDIPDYAAMRRRKQERSTPSIEMAFSKLKTLLRKRAARSFDTITKALGDIVSPFSVEECQNFFRASGYEAE